jgi:hypothetical protein
MFGVAIFPDSDKRIDALTRRQDIKFQYSQLKGAVIENRR